VRDSIVLLRIYSKRCRPTGVPRACRRWPFALKSQILTSRSALEGERKQVTVLFCDIANSTSLAERLGEERMHRLLNRFFELALTQVHRYEGTINQFLGDGLMALFGAPLAHEDHARRAVLAALDIRHALAEATEDPQGIEARIGLNTGPVVVGTIGDNLRMDYTAVGDTTNLAARLQQHAEPGAILISETTERLVHGYIRSERLSPMRVKGKSEPIVGFTVRGRGPRRSPLEGNDERILGRFVGRGRELSTLADVLAEVEARRGQVVGIVGEAGVGKSRLLYEFR
jgi:class 3 adenylate cyclase